MTHPHPPNIIKEGLIGGVLSDAGPFWILRTKNQSRHYRGIKVARPPCRAQVGPKGFRTGDSIFSMRLCSIRTEYTRVISRAWVVALTLRAKETNRYKMLDFPLKKESRYSPSSYSWLDWNERRQPVSRTGITLTDLRSINKFSLRVSTPTKYVPRERITEGARASRYIVGSLVAQGWRVEKNYGFASLFRRPTPIC